MSKVEFLTPVARLVAGDAWTPATEDMQGNRMKIASGPKAGQETQQYFLHLAVSKQDPELMPFLSKLYAFARTVWPQWFNGPAGWPDNLPGCTHPQFSFKWMDGDGVDGNGQPNNTKEGYAGCIILKTASAYAPKVFLRDHYAPHEEIKDPNALKRGFFVRVGGMMDSNGFPTKPGVKLYCGQVAVWGVGPEIVSGPSAQQVFGAAQASVFVPAGMQALPQTMLPAANPLAGAPAPLAMPGAAPIATTGFVAPAAMPGMPAAPMAAAPLPAPGALPAPTFVTPNPALMAGPGAAPTMTAPSMPAPPMAMPAPPTGPQLTAKGAATGQTYAAMLQAGWTEQLLREQGYVV